MTTLRSRARLEKEELQGYLDEGKRLFDSTAVSFEEVGAKRRALTELAGKAGRMMELKSLINGKNKLLAQVRCPVVTARSLEGLICEPASALPAPEDSRPPSAVKI